MLVYGLASKVCVLNWKGSEPRVLPVLTFSFYVTLDQKVRLPPYPVPSGLPVS